MATPPRTPTGTPDPRRPPAADFSSAFDGLAGLAYRVAYRIVGDREDAREIAQETMARAFARWPRVRDRASGWVVTVAGNLALDHVRRRRRRGTEPAADPSVGGTSVGRASEGGASAGGAAVDGSAATRADLVEALLALPQRQREVVVLRYLADLPEAEVARSLGCSTGSVKTHAHRGLTALRALLDPPGIVPALEDR